MLLTGILDSCSNFKEFTHPDPDSVILNELQLRNLDDSTYTGKYKVGPVKVIVKVTALNHAITGIEIVKHRTGQGQAAENIINKVIDRQSVRVDVISGATISSKCILKAIETALIE